MKNTAELVAATHVADGHVISIDHAEPFVARSRLADHAQAAQSSQSIHAARRTDHVDSIHEATSMMTVCVSVNGLTPDLFSRARHGRAVTGHAAEEAASAMRERQVFLHETGRTFTPSPVSLCEVVDMT